MQRITHMNATTRSSLVTGHLSSTASHLVSTVTPATSVALSIMSIPFPFLSFLFLLSICTNGLPAAFFSKFLSWLPVYVPTVRLDV